MKSPRTLAQSGGGRLDRSTSDTSKPPEPAVPETVTGHTWLQDAHPGTLCLPAEPPVKGGGILGHAAE